MISNDTTVASIAPNDPRNQLLDLWNEKKLSLGQLPNRRDFHPREMLSILPNISIWQWNEKKNTVTCRLIGTGKTDVLGHNPTGQSFDLANILPLLPAHSLESLTHEHQPVFFNHKTLTLKNNPYRISGIICPLINADNEDAVTMMLCYCQLTLVKPATISEYMARREC